MRLAIMLLFTVAVCAQSPYTQYQRGPITAHLIKLAGLPPGVPLDNPTATPPRGFLLVVATETHETEAFRVTIRYLAGSTEQSRTQFAPRTRATGSRWTWVWLLTSTDNVRPISISIDELRVSASTDFICGTLDIGTPPLAP